MDNQMPGGPVPPIEPGAQNTSPLNKGLIIGLSAAVIVLLAVVVYLLSPKPVDNFTQNSQQQNTQKIEEILSKNAPANSRLLSSSFENEKAILNFSKEIISEGFVKFEDLFQKISITLSDYRQFNILIDGKPLDEIRTENETAEWKIYKNEKYGFEFQYPNKNLSVKEGYVSSIDPKNLVYIANIYTIPAGPHAPDREGLVGVFNVPLNQALESLAFGDQQLPTIAYNGIRWTKLPRQDTPSDYLVEKNGNTFWLVYGGSIKESDFESIINSFKFTN